MRVVGDRSVTVFVEGEPDLQPPEELALDVLDEAGLLHDDVGCELVDEIELEDQLAEDEFDDLVHSGDEADDDPELSPGEFFCHGCYQIHLRRLQGDPVGPFCRRCAT